MNIKGISFWEQHVERIVLGVAGLVAVGFLAMQFVGNPNEVEVAGEKFAENVNSKLQAKAEQYEGNLLPDAPTPIKIDSPETVKEEFLARLGGTSQDARLAVAFHPAFAIGDGAAVSAPDAPYRLVTLPAPENVRTEQYFDGLSAGAIDGFPELAERYPEAPYDATWLTAAAAWDLKSVRAMLSTPGPNGELPVPEGWYNGKLPILFVRVDREELVDGEWTNFQTLDPIPGQADVLDIIESEQPSSTDRRYIFEYLGDNTVQTDIVQPLFYSTANNSWSPPSPDEVIADTPVFEDEDEDARKIRNLRRQLVRKQSEHDRIWNLLDAAGGPLDSLPGDDKKKDDGGRGGSDDLLGGGGGGGLRSPGDDKKEQSLKQRVAWTRTWKRLQKQVAGLRDRLSELIGEVVEVAETTEAESVMDSDRLIMWAHDLDVQPYKTYRYRFSIDVYNPYFGKRLNLIDSQQDLAGPIYVTSPQSGWSEPITAQPPLRVFVTAASSEARGGIGGSEGWARAEVFRFKGGRWWMENFRVGPGDRIGATKTVGERGATQSIDFGTDWFLLDVFADLDADERQSSRDRTAAAILQSLSTSDVMEVREPRREAQSYERDELQAEVDTADAGALTTE